MSIRYGSNLIAGIPSDYQSVSNMVQNLDDPGSDTYPSSQAVSDAIITGTTTKVNEDMDNVTTTGTSNIAKWGMPDYSGLVSLSSGYTATENGYCFFVHWRGSTHTVAIDGTTIYSQVNNYSNYSDPTAITVPLAKGSTITYANMSSATFAPCLGG